MHNALPDKNAHVSAPEFVTSVGEKIMLKPILVAAIATAAMATSAAAATLNGDFTVTAVNVTNLDSVESRATMTNYDLALLGDLGGVDNGSTVSSFDYSGDLNFGTFDGTDATTIADWLATGTDGGAGTFGTVSGLDGAFGDLQLSKPNIGNGTATTTFFLFTTVLNMVGDFIIDHDDGIAVMDDGTRIGGSNGPTSEITTEVFGFDGGEFSLLYVATNGDPSVLRVNGDLAPIPLPATLPLLLVGMGGLAMMRRNRG